MLRLLTAGGIVELQSRVQPANGRAQVWSEHLRFLQLWQETNTVIIHYLEHSSAHNASWHHKLKTHLALWKTQIPAYDIQLNKMIEQIVRLNCRDGVHMTLQWAMLFAELCRLCAVRCWWPNIWLSATTTVFWIHDASTMMRYNFEYTPTAICSFVPPQPIWSLS